MQRSRRLNRRRVDTRFKLSKYYPRTEPSVENCGSPILRFSVFVKFDMSVLDSCRGNEGGAESLDDVPIYLADVLEIRKVMDETGVNHAIRAGDSIP